MTDFARKSMRLRTHRNHVYLLRALDPPDILASRAEKRDGAALELAPQELRFVRERLARSAPEPIFLPMRKRSAFLLPSFYPICEVFWLIVLEPGAEKVLPSLKNGTFGAVAYSDRLDGLGLSVPSSEESELIFEASCFIRALMLQRGAVDPVNAAAQAQHILELISTAADFLGVRLEATSRSMLGDLENCDRDMAAAFVLSALMFVHRAAKRRCGSIELSAVASRLWITLEADCLDGTSLDEFEPLRRSALLRDGCLRVTQDRGRVKVELCAHRADVSLIGLKQDPEFM